jgi:oligosaccharide translocation protein RFT1
LLTFVLNGYLLRRISKDTIGIVNVRCVPFTPLNAAIHCHEFRLTAATLRLTLLYTTCLFLSREGFRKACVSYGKDRWPVVANIVWLPYVSV